MPAMNVVIAGASGFIGEAVVRALRDQEHEVLRLVRRGAERSDEAAWAPAKGQLDPRVVSGVDAVINLAGENIAGGRWSKARRTRLLQSRVEATATLVGAMARAAAKPRVLLNASAVGFYGDRGDEVLTEASAAGDGFLTEVCRAWETEAAKATALGVRTVFLRFGTVLDRDGGALARMLPLFRLGLGGRLGGGRQWMSWVHRDDVVRVIEHALHDERLAGVVNVVSPEPVRNADFTAALGRALRRPTPLPAPAFALHAAFGALADEALLGSTRARPVRLEEHGYRFRFPTLDAALADIVSA